METKIIKLSDNFDKNRFLKYKEIKKQKEKQNYCSHDIGFTFDGQIDEILCDKCKKKWTSFEFLWYWSEKKSNVSYKIYEIENNIYFLNEEKVQLENFVNDLKSQKHKLSSWITRTKKQNDIKNNDWNATSNG